MVNVYLNESYGLRSTKDIVVDQELFLDYNLDVNCYFCGEDKKVT
jgi:hypothetical protein